MLSRCEQDVSVLPVTSLFNKRWLLRLLLAWFDSARDRAHALSPAEGARWYSDGLLASRFIGDGRGDKRAEGLSRVDGTVGHFHPAPGGRGTLSLDSRATQFVTIAAKFETTLSTGAKNASYYDQGARTVACMARLMEVAGVRPESLSTLSFHVIAPASRIRKGVFDRQLEKSILLDKVRHRTEVFGSAHRDWMASWFEPVLERITISALAWEDLLQSIRLTDKPAGMNIARFYEQCLRSNVPQ